MVVLFFRMIGWGGADACEKGVFKALIFKGKFWRARLGREWRVFTKFTLLFFQKSSKTTKAFRHF